jgi:hypothetical protein
LIGPQAADPDWIDRGSRDLLLHVFLLEPNGNDPGGATQREQSDRKYKDRKYALEPALIPAMNELGCNRTADDPTGQECADDRPLDRRRGKASSDTDNGVKRDHQK